MMKCYAVKKGRRPGIYFSWEKAKEQIHKYPGAVFKSFEDMDAAHAYIEDNRDQEAPEDFQGRPVAYIDGSYSKAGGLYSYGGFIRTGEDFHTIQGTGSRPEYLTERNIAGELMGALEVIREARRLQLPEIVLFFDYEGIQDFATGAWRPKTDLTRNYHREARELMDSLQIYFQYVQGHTGDPGNELADILAKEAAGVKLRKKDIKALEEYRADPGAFLLKAEKAARESDTGQ
jgi:ribonuclease HI